MVEILGALLAGVLTTLAPCVLPLLPVVVGGSVVGVPGATGPSRDVRRALVITAGLVGSVLAFTLLLRASTVLLGLGFGAFILHLSIRGPAEESTEGWVFAAGPALMMSWVLGFAVRGLLF